MNYCSNNHVETTPYSSSLISMSFLPILPLRYLSYLYRRTHLVPSAKTSGQEYEPHDDEVVADKTASRLRTRGIVKSRTMIWMIPVFFSQYCYIWRDLLLYGIWMHPVISQRRKSLVLDSLIDCDSSTSNFLG